MWILYLLRHQGSPKPFLRMLKKKKKKNSPFQITIESKQQLKTSNKSIKYDKRTFQCKRTFQLVKEFEL